MDGGDGLDDSLAGEGVVERKDHDDTQSGSRARETDQAWLKKQRGSMSDQRCKEASARELLSYRHIPLAHALEGGARLHPLEDHLASVARLAARFAGAFCDPAWGELAGRWHDLGKYAGNFQKMIREANGVEAHIEGDVSGPRDHSSAGAIHALESLGFAGLPLALVIAGHHGGLPAANVLIQDRIPRKKVDRCLERAVAGKPEPALLLASPPLIPNHLRLQTPEAKRRLEMWTRMLFSCLCDADFLDTEAFYEPERAALRGGARDLQGLQARLDGFLAALGRKAPDTEVNRVRAEVLDACRAAAKEPPGAFSLTVPTGGGKTLSSLAFALDHAVLHRLERVVVAIPYTSIIEQSAGAYREALGAEEVLECHSSLDLEKETPRSRVAAENWDAPVVVTTTVQLFESLFANRPSACRKLHNLVRSVIVLDEAQTLPPGLLAPILDALRTLNSDFGSSVVVSTATQPALGREQGLEIGFDRLHEIVPKRVRAFDRLRRVRAKWPRSDDPTELEALAAEVAAEPDVLAIVHRRADARALCEAVDRLLGGDSTIHLSALMCADHRSERLAEIKERKRRGEPVRVVATQLVEAGVDLDFPVVYRALGGLDALAQAAGRCNREGRLVGLGELRVFVPASRPPPGVPATAMSVTRGMLRVGGIDLFSPEPFTVFFQQLYGAKDLDAKGIQRAREGLDFEATAASFKLIEDGWSAPVVVPFGHAVEALRALEAEGPSRQRLRVLQRFVVTVPRRERDRWVATGAAREVAGAVVVLESGGAYDRRFGLLPERAGVVDAMTLIA